MNNQFERENNEHAWSTYMQTPQMLESTRMMCLNPDMAELIAKWIGIRPGMRILDVGCGTGAFGFYLANTVQGCEFTGLDCDRVFIERASELAAGRTGNTFSFVLGDALELPFQSDTFDVVVSHTFLTNIHDPALALKEMMRVGKSGGRIASITAESFQHIPEYAGDYPPSHGYHAEWQKLYQEVWEAYQRIKPFSSFVKGAHPLLVPRFFAQAKLWDIRMHSIGRSFSLSNAATAEEDKRRYIELSYESEKAKFTSYCRLEGFSVPEDKRERYLELLTERRDALLRDVGENYIWEWSGGSNLCMTAVIPPKMLTIGTFMR